jgi:tape measure domain-containing protein
MTMDIATLGIRVDATDVRGATGDLDRLGGAAGRTSTSISATERAAKLLSVAFASIGAAALARDLLKTIEQVQNLEVRLTGLTKSAKDYAETQKYLTDISKQHHKSNLQLQESFAGLLAIEQTGIITRQQSKQILEGMSNAQSKTGASADALKQSTLGLSQALSMGTLQWEEMKQVTEPIPGLLTKIAEAAGYTGKSAIGDFKNVVSAGQVTSDMFGRIMVDALSSYQGAAEAAGETLTAKYADIGNAWTELAKAIESPVVNTISPILELITEQINGLAQDLRELNDFYNQIKSAAGYNTGGAPDNGMAVNLTGRAKPPAQADQSKTDAAAIRAEIEATAASTKGKKAHKEAISEEQKAINALANAYENQISTLLRSIALEGKSSATAAAEYDVQNGALKGLTEAKKLYFLQQTAILQNKQLETKAHEAEKSELDSLIDKYNQLTLSARDYKLTQLNAQGISGSEQAPIMAQFDKNAGAEATKKATDDATASLDAYNKKLDDANTKTSDLGAVTSAIFDGALGGITAMAGAFDAMVASIDANTKKLQENADAKKLNEATVDPVKKAANFEKYAKAEAKLNNDNVKASLTGASQMAGAAANLFDKKSSAAKAFHNIEIGLSVLRLAMDIKEIASSMTKTAVKTAEGASTMFAQSGWLGFAGVAAMLAVMAGLGFASGGSGGASEPPKSNDGTGTVLGDSSAKSESLAKTNDLLKNIHASEYVELRGINAGVNNLSKSILNTVTQLFQGGGLSGVSLTQTDALTGISKSLNTLMAIGTGGLSILVSKIPLIGGIFDKVNSFLFGGKQTQSVVGQGIETWGTNLGGVISGGNVAAGEYADIKTHTSGGLFGKSKDSYMTGYQAVGADMQKALNDVFKNVGTNLLVVAKSLGQGLTETVKKAIIPAMRVDLMGLTGEDAAKKLNNVIGATLDTMSSDIFGKVVGKYQQLGEGMFETASRIVMEVEIVKDAFAQSGKKLTGDVIGIADAFIQASGGLEEFQKRFEFFIDKFTTDAEKQTRATKTIKGSLKEEFTDAQIKKALSSRDNYASMVDFRAGKKGKENIAEYALLLEMAPKLDEYFSNKESLANDKTAMNIKLMDLQGNKSGALAKTRELELAAMDKTLRPMQQLIYAQTDLNNANTLAAALLAKRNTQEIQLMNLSGDTAGALAKTRALELAAMDESLWLKQNEIYAQTDLNTANEKAKTDLNAANEAAKALATSRANLEIKLMEAQGRTAEALAKTRELEIAAMDESLWKTQNLIYAFTDINTAMDKATGDVTTAMSRLTELSGKLKSTLSSTAIETSASLKADRANANALLKTALIIAKMGGAIDNITGMDKALADVAKPSEQLYTTFTDYARDQAITSNTISELSGYADKQVSMAQKQLDAINGTTTAIEKTLPEALAVLMGLDAQKKALPQFASGGYHSGGWRVVGENGPELEHTGASRIFSNGQSKGLLSTDELVAELQALRAEVRAGQEAIANNTRQTAKILRDVTQDGQSITTSAVVV